VILQRAGRPPTPILDTGMDPAAYYGWSHQAPDDVMESNTTTPDVSYDRKPPDLDDSDEDCFTIKLSWRDSTRVGVVELWKMHLNPLFAVKDHLYTRLHHGAKISVFPDPDASYYILWRQSMQLRLALETQTENFLQVEGVGHMGPIRRFLCTPTQSMAI
jgi:hypothetical protein